MLVAATELIGHPTSVSAFVAPASKFSRTIRLNSAVADVSDEYSTIEDTEERKIQRAKPAGTTFLPEETVERAGKGSPIEKIKLKKDGISAFVDVYEYARKIREGEMTWEEVEKADLDTVSNRLSRRCFLF